MKRTRIDSRIEVWDRNYINDPSGRASYDRDLIIEQIEPLNDVWFIVEVYEEGGKE